MFDINPDLEHHKNAAVSSILAPSFMLYQVTLSILSGLTCDMHAASSAQHEQLLCKLLSW